MKNLNYSEIEKKVEDIDKELEELSKNIERKRNELKADLEDSFQGIITSKLNKDYLKEFAKKPYAIIPNYRKDNEWIIAVPKFIDFSLGWLERSDDAWNYFIVNRYFNWLSKIPKELQQKFNFKEPIPLKVFDGVVLTGEKHQEETWKRYGKYLSKREGKDRIRIKRGYEFKIIASMINDGILPFMPKPVVKADLIDSGMKYKLRDYQQEAWDKFLQTGAVGIYHPFGSGKTCIGLWALGHIRVNDLPNLVIVPTKTLKEQWIVRIAKHIPDLKYDIEIETYNVYERLKNKEFGLVIFDECHRLPANTFSKLSTIPIKYRIGLCLDKNTLIETNKGIKKLKEITFKDKVKSFNFETKKEEYKQVINIWNTKKEVIEITFSTPEGIKKIRCSPEHKIFSNGKFKKAKDLSSKETIIFRGIKYAN